MDIKIIDDLRQYFKDIPSGASISRYLEWLHNGFQEKDPLYLSDYEPIVREEEVYRNDNRPFLSVITRTQGKRPEMLRETLLCLAGQSDQDFEVIVIGHKLDNDQTETVEGILNEQPDFLRKKIRFFKLDHGTRTTPLNFGFAHAHGEYIAILDDDDIVFDHWISSFHKAAVKRPGAVLHAGVLSQDWMTVGTDSGMIGLRATDAHDDKYVKEFDFFRQMRCNNCPIIGIAFPAYLLQKLGMIFDESLTTTEDWDYLMRCVFVAGVEDINDATSIYRHWKNAESSATVHKKEEWDENYVQIINKFMDMPLIIPAGVRKSLSQETLYALLDSQWQYRYPRIENAVLYFDRGLGFSQEDTVLGRFLSNGKIFDVFFGIPDNGERQIQHVRFDPGEEGLILIEKVLAVFEYEDGTFDNRTLSGTITNGLNGENEVFFMKNDPWIIWTGMQKPLKSVRILGEMRIDVTEDMIMRFINSNSNVEQKHGRLQKARAALNKLTGKH